MVASLAVLYKETRGELEEKFRLYYAMGMFGWWFISLICLAFFGPFASVMYANGFIGVWGAFFTSLMLLSSRNEYVGEIFFCFV